MQTYIVEFKLFNGWYDSIEVEAENEEQAIEMAYDEPGMDYDDDVVAYLAE